MRFKRLLALLVSAALALSLLAGCGGGKSLSQVIVDLLNGLYSNVSVEADSDLTAALKQAAAEGGTEEEILSRMIEILNLNGGSITFTRLGSGQQGDHAVTLYFQTGTDPDAAARSALAQWASTLGTLPDDGSYQGDVAMIEADNGYYIALDVEVIKAGSRDDESTPVTLKSLSVTGLTTTGYKVGDKFDPVGITVSAVYSDGHSEPLLSTDYTITIDGSSPGTDYVFKKADSYTLKITYKGQELTQTIEVSNNPSGYYQSADGSYVVTGSDGLEKLFTDKEDIDNFTGTITLTCDQTVSTRLAETFNGTLEGESAGNESTITFSGSQSVFATVNGFVRNVNFKVNSIQNSGNTGVVAGNNFGTIENCDVTVTGTITTASTTTCYIGGIVGLNYGGIIKDCHITIPGGITSTLGYAGGVVGYNYDDGKIENCSVENLSLTAADYVGGIAGRNEGTIQDCKVGDTVTIKGTSKIGGITGYNYADHEIFGCDSSADITSSGFYVGGIAGQNQGSIQDCHSFGDVLDNGTNSESIGGVVGQNFKTVTNCSASGTITSNGVYVGGVVGDNTGTGVVTACYSISHVSGGYAGIGGVAGLNSGILTACYSTGNITSQTLNSDCRAGGVVGWNNGGSVTACYFANGNVIYTGYSGKNVHIGGVAGRIASGSVDVCYWSGNSASGNGIGYGSGTATKVEGTTNWAAATNAMNTKCRDLFKSTGENTPPKLYWEN